MAIFCHLIIPHVHHGEITYEEHTISHEEAKSVIDYIRLAFHQNSNSSFDNYTFSENSQLINSHFNNPDILANSTFTKKDVFSRVTILYFSFQFQIGKSPIPISYTLRGPPAFDYYS